MSKIEQELMAIETMIYVIRGQRVMLQPTEIEEKSLRCQFGTSKEGKGGRRYLPYAFHAFEWLK